jgi:hypothetical protein
MGRQVLDGEREDKEERSMTYATDIDGASDEESVEASLRDIIIAQGEQETGIFVLLFTPASLHASAGSKDDLAVTVAQVDDAAAELGLDPQRLTLFSEDAYLLQAALGERALPEPA